MLLAGLSNISKLFDCPIFLTMSVAPDVIIQETRRAH